MQTYTKNATALLGALLISLLLLAGCVSTGHNSASLLGKLNTQEPVAVTTIHDETNGNITLLSDHIRDKVEAALARRGVVVKARKDLVGIIDDAELGASAGEDTEARLWTKAGAAVVVRGSYSVLPVPGNETQMDVQVLLKAFRSDTVELLDSEEMRFPMERGRLTALSQVTGNIYQQQFKTVVGSSMVPPPFLQARLNRPDGCYRPGDTASLVIDTEEDIFLSLFSLSCDGNVAVLWPEPNSKESRVQSSHIIFPPAEGSRIKALHLQPAKRGEICRESFKIVASRDKLDFSYLPFPANKIYSGINGKDIERITNTLKNSSSYNQIVLDYRIDAHCPGH